MASIHKASGMKPLEKTYSLQPKNQQEALKQKLKKVGDMYEQHFINHMVKQMRGTISHSKYTKPTMAENIYRNKLDDEYVKSWVGRGGLGLSDLIYEQLAEKFLPKKPNFGKPQGPIPMNNQRMFKLNNMEQGPNKHNFKLEMNDDKKDPVALTSPWGAKLIELKALSSGMNSLLLNHGDGVHSSYIFQGQALGLTKEQNIQPGQTLANLAPGSSLFFSLRS